MFDWQVGDLASLQPHCHVSSGKSSLGEENQSNFKGAFALGAGRNFFQYLWLFIGESQSTTSNDLSAIICQTGRFKSRLGKETGVRPLAISKLKVLIYCLFQGLLSHLLVLLPINPACSPGKLL